MPLVPGLIFYFDFDLIFPGLRSHHICSSCIIKNLERRGWFPSAVGSPLISVRLQMHAAGVIAYKILGGLNSLQFVQSSIGVVVFLFYLGDFDAALASASPIRLICTKPTL